MAMLLRFCCFQSLYNSGFKIFSGGTSHEMEVKEERVPKTCKRTIVELKKINVLP
jgi:hypothetical protein